MSGQYNRQPNQTNNRYKSLDLEKFYTSRILLPEITSLQFREWLLSQEQSTHPENATFDIERKLQLISQIMELNNPKALLDVSLYDVRVEWILQELEDLMDHLERNPPVAWLNNPFLEIRMITFNPSMRYGVFG